MSAAFVGSDGSRARARRAVIFTAFWPDGAGASALTEVLARGGVLPDDFVMCADGGYAVCACAGICPDVVIGDFDSLSPDETAKIDAAGILRVVHPKEKEDTDTMLCVKYGQSKGFEEFTLVGGVGGDFGHTMANLQTLSFLTDMECTAEILTPRERLFMADGQTVLVHREAKPPAPVSFTGRAGAKFSVFSYAERSSGVVIQNAKYELSDAVLTQSYPIGVSNEFVNAEPVTVSVRFGRLLIVAETETPPTIIRS